MTHVCQWPGLALIQVQTCRMFGTKLLPEPNAAILSMQLIRKQIQLILN